VGSQRTAGIFGEDVEENPARKLELKILKYIIVLETAMVSNSEGDRSG
jgi:hypothetical protein